MSDILDVMNIKSFPQKKKNEKEPTPFQSQQNFSEVRQIYTPEEHASQNKRRKLSAMNRELYNLIGSNVPPLAIDTASVSNAGGSKKFKNKLVNSKKNAPWRNLGFKNSARNDGLILHHWTKSKLQSVESKESPETPIDDKTEDAAKPDTAKIEEELDPQEYRYTKYNTKLDIPKFTEEEYNEAVKTEENNIRKELELKQAKEKIKQEKIESEKNAETKELVEKLEDNKVEKNDQADNSAKLPSVETQESNTSNKLEEKNTEVEKGSGSDSNKELKDPAPQESKDNKKEEKFLDETKERPWTYEETKYLFDLCSDLDMRWAVIFDTYQDRYSDRTLEDLKVQMYSISASLLEKRGNPNDSALIKALRTFNKEKEISRKFYLTKLIHRAPTEIAEEESLVIEARKFELAAKKMLYERGQLLQLLDSPQSSASVQQYLTSQGLTQLYNSLMASDKGKKRKAEVPVAPLLGPNAIPHTQHISMSNSSNSSSNNMTNLNSNNKRRANAVAAAAAAAASSTTTVASVSTPKPANNSNTNKNPSKLTEVQQLLQKSLTPEELEIYGIEIHNDRLQPGVYVRSQKIASFKPSVQAKVHEILGQLGLSVKPNIPTGPVSKKFDDLLYKISHLVDLKKQSDKLLAEIELIKRQKGVL